MKLDVSCLEDREYVYELFAKKHMPHHATRLE
jgi:hypothetical protein